MAIQTLYKELTMETKTTVICYHYEIDKIMDVVYSKYGRKHGTKVTKRSACEYHIVTDYEIIIVKAKPCNQDDDIFMLWFKGRDLGNVILTKEMEYLKRNAEFLSRVRNGGILVINLEEL